MCHNLVEYLFLKLYFLKLYLSHSITHAEGVNKMRAECCLSRLAIEKQQ